MQLNSPVILKTCDIWKSNRSVAGIFTDRDALEKAINTLLSQEDVVLNADSPFSVLVGVEQIDLLPANKDLDVVGQEPKWMFAIYTEKDGKVFEIPARYRRVDELPCLKEWGKA